jgi:hypothetical protein
MCFFPPESVLPLVEKYKVDKNDNYSNLWSHCSIFESQCTFDLCTNGRKAHKLISIFDHGRNLSQLLLVKISENKITTISAAFSNYSYEFDQPFSVILPSNPPGKKQPVASWRRAWRGSSQPSPSREWWRPRPRSSWLKTLEKDHRDYGEAFVVTGLSEWRPRSQGPVLFYSGWDGLADWISLGIPSQGAVSHSLL